MSTTATRPQPTERAERGLPRWYLHGRVVASLLGLAAVAYLFVR
jgi:hypothetical protein